MEPIDLNSQETLRNNSDMLTSNSPNTDPKIQSPQLVWTKSNYKHILNTLKIENENINDTKDTLFESLVYRDIVIQNMEKNEKALNMEIERLQSEIALLSANLCRMEIDLKAKTEELKISNSTNQKLTTRFENDRLKLKQHMNENNDQNNQLEAKAVLSHNAEHGTNQLLINDLIDINRKVLQLLNENSSQCVVQQTFLNDSISTESSYSDVTDEGNDKYESDSSDVKIIENNRPDEVINISDTDENETFEVSNLGNSNDEVYYEGHHVEEKSLTDNIDDNTSHNTGRDYDNVHSHDDGTAVGPTTESLLQIATRKPTDNVILRNRNLRVEDDIPYLKELLGHLGNPRLIPNEGMKLVDYIEIMKTHESLKTIYERDIETRWEGLNPQLNELCSRIILLPCPNGMRIVCPDLNPSFEMKLTFGKLPLPLPQEYALGTFLDDLDVSSLMEVRSIVKL